MNGFDIFKLKDFYSYQFIIVRFEFSNWLNFYI